MVVATIMIARGQIKNKEQLPTIDRTVLNILGILANCDKLKGNVNAIRIGG
jgi:hypothetical protein